MERGSQKGDDDRAGYGHAHRPVLVTGMVVSLSLGLADQMVFLTAREGEFPYVWAILEALAAATITVFAVYCILWFVIARPLWGMLKRGGLERKMSLGPIVPRYGLCIPFILAELFLYVLVTKQEFGMVAGSYGALVVLMAAMLGTFFLFRFLRKEVGSAAAFGFFVLLVTVVPAHALLRAAGSKAVPSPSADAAQHPVARVILIVVDALRADALTFSNPKAPPTPHLDEFAADGLVFTRAISPAPWTIPSVFSMLTAAPALVHMATKWDGKLPEALPTVAECMLDAGYTTGGIVNNRLLTAKRGTARGFVEYKVYPMVSTWRSFGMAVLQWLVPSWFRYEATGDVMTDLGIDWLKRNRGRDCFLWLHYMDPHVPYAPPRRFQPESEPPPGMERGFAEPNQARRGLVGNTSEEREWIRQLYDGEVRYVDAALGRLFEGLRELGVYEESLIIVTSDHGEEFWEHGAYEHGHSLCNEVLHVPLIIKVPFSERKGSIKVLVSTVSLTPTILDFCGVGYEKRELQPPSLTGLCTSDRGGFVEQPVISTGIIYSEEEISVHFGWYKYVVSVAGGAERLFDLKTDPHERDSIVAVRPERAEEARAILEEHKRVAAALRERLEIGVGEQVELDDEELQELRRLGYMQ